MHFFAILAFMLGSAPGSATMNNNPSLLDIRAACDTGTNSRNRQLVKSKSPDPNDQGDLCVDRSIGISSLPVVSVDLGHNKVTDSYALRLHIDPKREVELHDFSSKNLGKELVLIKDGNYVFRARIYAPIDNGAMLLIVPDKNLGVSLAKILFNQSPDVP